jgi:hypothetical protein
MEVLGEVLGEVAVRDGIRSADIPHSALRIPHYLLRRFP